MRLREGNGMAEEVLARQIADQLRRDILRGRLPPGASIKERDNAAEMGVSRTPMREAIRMLAQEGLVELRPARSPIVAQPGIKTVADQSIVLISLEKLSAELACAEASDAEIARVSDIVDHMAEHFDTTDPLDMFEIDMTFHMTIAEISQNEALFEAHGALLRRLWRARYLSAVMKRNRDRVIDQHTAILSALRARDPDAARAAIDRHLGRMGDDIRDALQAETGEAQARRA